MFTTQNSIQDALRWLRRMLVMILILVNFIAVTLADAGSVGRDSRAAFYVSSLLLTVVGMILMSVWLAKRPKLMHFH